MIWLACRKRAVNISLIFLLLTFLSIYYRTSYSTLGWCEARYDYDLSTDQYINITQILLGQLAGRKEM